MYGSVLYTIQYYCLHTYYTHLQVSFECNEFRDPICTWLFSSYNLKIRNWGTGRLWCELQGSVRNQNELLTESVRCEFERYVTPSPRPTV